MTRKAASILITFTVWSILVCLHAYYWVSNCMADTGCRDYEGIWVLPLMAYMLYVFPIWVIGLIVVAVFELILIPNHPRFRSTGILKV